MGPFEPFDPQQAGARGTPVIYVLSEGRLILNAAAGRLLAGVEWVQLLWDSDTKRIGLRATTAQDPLALKITPGNSQSTITSKAFVIAHGLPYKVRMLLARDGDLWVASTTDPGKPLG